MNHVTSLMIHPIHINTYIVNKTKLEFQTDFVFCFSFCYVVQLLYAKPPMPDITRNTLQLTAQTRT